MIHQEVLEKLLGFPVARIASIEQESAATDLTDALTRRKTNILQDVNQRNLKYFEAEVDKLDGWADDLKVGLEQEIKELDKEIRDVRRTAKAAPELEEKLSWQKKQRELEKLRSRKRRELFDKQDEVDTRRDELINELEGKLQQKIEESPLFAVAWAVK